VTGLVRGLTADINAPLADPSDPAWLRTLITTLTTTLGDLVRDVLDAVLEGRLPLVADPPALPDTPVLSLGELDVTTVARTDADELAAVPGTVWALQDVRIPAEVSRVAGGVWGGLPVALPPGGLQRSALPADRLRAPLS
jgi:hypothetical protein